VDVGDVGKSEGSQRRKSEPDTTRDVADGVAAAVAVGVRVGKLADADAIEDGEEDS
jgi:hypothetical protein